MFFIMQHMIDNKTTTNFSFMLLKFSSKTKCSLAVTLVQLVIVFTVVDLSKADEDFLSMRNYLSLRMPLINEDLELLSPINNNDQLYTCLHNCAICVRQWKSGIYNGRLCAEDCMACRDKPTIMDADCNNVKYFNLATRTITNNQKQSTK